MSPDSISQISLGSAALIIFAVCAAYVVLRGMTRMLIGTLVLAGSAWLAFRVWQQSPNLSTRWLGHTSDLVTLGLPLVVFLTAFFLIRKVAKLAVSPLRTRQAEDAPPRTLSRMAMRLALTLIPASLLWTIGAVMVHHFGSIAEIRTFVETSAGIEPTPEIGFAEKLKGTIAATLPASWLKALDPLAEPGRLALAKLIASEPGVATKYPPVIDPETGKPYPRAIIVDDPDLQGLARHQQYSTLLHHPSLTAALDDPKVQQAIRNRQ